MTSQPDSQKPAVLPDIPPSGVLRRITAPQTASISSLKQEWRELFAGEPPAFSRPYLQSRLAYRIQELAYGGLKPETEARLESLGRKLDGGKVALRRLRADHRPIAGTKLIREWQGIQHAVTVTSTSFEFEGRLYQLLSAIARVITGTRWNGPLFFGLRGRDK
jgi:hypothetical protein